MAYAMFIILYILSTGGAAVDSASNEGRVHFSPRASVLRVMGCYAESQHSASTLREEPSLRLGRRRLSVAAQQYLARLAVFQQRQISEPSDTSVASEVQHFLAEQMRGIGPVVFFTRHPLARPRMAGCAIGQSVPHRRGCSIRIYNPAQPDVAPRTIFEDPEGCIFDMNLSQDAATIFFAFRGSADPCWQIHKIGVDGQGLTRVSRDPAHHDISPVQLSDGNLLFISTRGGGYLASEPGPRSNIWIMPRDGGDAWCVSQNTLADFSPCLLPDGRTLFTRWEYVDRDLEYRQGLWTQRPDGTQFQLFFGNTIREVGMFWQARPVPGHDDVVIATFAPATGWPHGAIGLVTNRRGPEAARDQGFAWLTDESLHVGDITSHADGMSYHDVDDGRLLELALRDTQLRAEEDPADLSLAHEWEARAGLWLDRARPAYRDPFPVGDHLFLVSYADNASQRFDLYLLDLCGNRVPFYSDPEIGSYSPLLLRPQAIFATSPAHHRITNHDRQQNQWGTALVTDVYQGLSGIAGIARGQAKYLQIMEQVPKSHEVARRAYDQSPVMGYGTYYAKRCWGRVPIEPDGSAHFDLPALREVYLQVLDAEGRELHRQTSSIQVMPGEVRSCLGCHEPRSAAPPASSPPTLAARRPPTRLEPPPWANDGLIDFPTVVQPVLDRHCTRCHSGPDPDGGCDLSGDKTRLFNMAYDNLLGRSRAYRQYNLTTGEMLSQESARGRPLVQFYWLRRSPTGTSPPGVSGSHASRIGDYLGPDHCGQEISWEDRQRIYTWIDANVPYYADYAVSRPHSPGGRDLCTDSVTGREATWFASRFLEVYNRRCATCHNEFPHPNDHDGIWDGRFAWINFTHPEWSPALSAHLSKDAGGRGISTKRFTDEPMLFADLTDPDYVTMFEAICEGRRQMLARPRADMQGPGP
ncbi:MAG: HzsA-related protein [Pirellulaceae bacterium]